jgi:PTH2 family peptidyl-tRNA hydrolase
MSFIKQVIVMRKDLGMRKGKMIAQGAHASMAVILDMMQKRGVQMASYEAPEQHWYDLHTNKDVASWIDGSFTKVCLYVNSEEELLDIKEKANAAGLPNALITDAGKTEFNGVPTKTCVGIGPAQADKIDEVTGDLKLL